MIIVMGHLRVHPDDRVAYLDTCRSVVVAARESPGCDDFHLSADPLEADRINVVERWRSRSELEAFRGSGPAPDLTDRILEADVREYDAVDRSAG